VEEAIHVTVSDGGHSCDSTWRRPLMWQ